MKDKYMSKKDDTPTDMEKAVDFYRGQSEVGNTGVRRIPKAAYMERLDTEHGVDEATLKKVQNAVDHETTVAAHVSLADVEDSIKAASKDQLADEEFRRNLSATTRLPTLGGSTEVTVNAEKLIPIPGRPDADGNVGERSTKLLFGQTRTTIQAKYRIEKTFHEEAASRLRSSLGIKEN